MSVQQPVDSVDDSAIEKTAEDSLDSASLRRRLRHAQQNIAFLQDQHKCTLSDLHSELDRLKMQNKEQQWRLVLAGQYGGVPDIDMLQTFSHLSTQTENVINSDGVMHTKRLAEENADLRNEVEFLRKATEKYKSEILNQTKRLEITTRQPDARRLVKPTYRSRYSPRAQSVSGLRVISRPGVAASKNLPAIPGAVQLEGQSSDGRAKTVTLPALRGVNQNVKHQRRLDAINFRKLN